MTKDRTAPPPMPAYFKPPHGFPAAAPVAPLSARLHPDGRNRMSENAGSNPPPPGARPQPPANPPAMPLSSRLRDGVECAPWVIDAVQKLEAEVKNQRRIARHEHIVAENALGNAKAPEVSEVTRQLIERDQTGRAKYGTTLDRADLSLADWLQHMAEELLDGAGYALAAKRELQSAAPAAAPVAPVVVNGRQATHYCYKCGALWLEHAAGWSLVSQSMGKCCDNVPMEGQIVPLGAVAEKPAEAEAPASLGLAGDDKVLWGVVANSGHNRKRKSYRWAHVMEATGLGSTSAIALCVRFGFDPDKMTGGDADGEAP